MGTFGEAPEPEANAAAGGLNATNAPGSSQIAFRQKLDLVPLRAGCTRCSFRL